MVYLKAVEALGFKSFADKTIVSFDPGLTAIVGPNGSGKSNITDAIRWVLGEQSAKNLRGAKMEDVIFSGAANRSPQNYAEVTLKLDNTTRQLDVDQDLIAVTRRLYRSGESEYVLNGQKARLKDITELFLDTGLGKEAFSIISQGKVDEILNAKSEDRRHLIEEAAGVLKYKRRKKETTLKLDETMGNLARVNDIIFDLEGRIEPLAQEAAIAEEYEALMEEMRTSDIQITAHDIGVLKATHAQLETEIKEFEEMIALKSDKLSRLDSRMTIVQTENSSLQQQYEEGSNRRLVLTEQIERTQGQLGVLKEKLENFTASSERLKQELAKQEVNIKALTDEAAVFLEEQHSLSEQLKEMKQTEQRCEKKLTELNSDIDALIESARESYYETLSEQTNSKNELRLIERQIDEAAHFISKHEDLDAKAYDEAVKKAETVNAVLQQTDQQLNEVRTAYKTKLTQVNQQQQQYRTQQDNLYKAYQYIDQLKAKHASLLAMQEDFQGYYQGVRAVLRDRTLQGIHGPIASLIVTEKRYQTAVDIALGGQLQNIVVDDEQAARTAIRHLKEKRAGRATFMPLTTIKGRAISRQIIQQVESIDGYVGRLTELVTFKETYQAVIEQLTGLTLVAEHIRAANDIARAADFKYRVVTLDGNVVNPGGSMTGGSSNQPSQLLKQREEEEALRKKLADYTTSTEQMEQTVQTLKASISEQEFQLNELQQEGETLAEKRQELNFEKGTVDNEVTALRRSNELFNEVTERKSELEQLKQQKAAYAQSINQYAAALTSIEEQLEEYTSSATDKKSLEKSLNDELTTIRSNRIALEERLKYHNERIHQLNERILAAEKERDDLIDQSKLSSTDEMNDKLQELTSLYETLQQERTLLEERVVSWRNELQQFEETYAAYQSDYNETMRQMNGLENGIGEMKGKYARNDVQLENLIFHLLEDYHMTYEAAVSHIDTDADIELMRKRVKLTKMSIEELGPVNIGAIQQYKDVKARYDFLSEQEADLLAAKTTLESIIKEMDTEVTTRFTATFEAVQLHFSEVFKSLFGGGTGELVLTGEDELTAGIDIIAEPPGKKRQHLTLLSGGERALTAVALLFAILKVRSAPFVILDEVEAALDEANVLRFGQYLHTLSDQTQFIVITHRKGTMEAADRLYGVTMQNSGITQLVGVDLNELDNKKMKELTR